MTFFYAFLFPLLACLTFFSPLQGSDPSIIHLKDQFQKAQIGDFIIALQNKCYTLLRIHDKNESSVTIEEITVPENVMGCFKDNDTKNLHWRRWVQQGAPKNSSWVIYLISLKTGKIEEYYSYTRQSWIDVNGLDNLLPSLLNIPFQFIPPAKRRKVGPPPLYGEADKRNAWQPRLITDGKMIPKAKFEAFTTVWPKDESPLANKTIEIYLPLGYPQVPSYFPYWLQVEDKVATVKVRVVDSGKQMTSLAPGLPRKK